MAEYALKSGEVLNGGYTVTIGDYTLRLIGGYEARWTNEYDTENQFTDYKGDTVRTDCLFARPDGRLYRFNGGLISCGLTDAQAELLQKLTPKELANETELEALKAAGEIIPGQLYYIAEAE